LIGDWGLGIGAWGLGPKPQTPIPNPQSPIPIEKFIFFDKNLMNIIIFKIINKFILILKYNKKLCG